MGVEDSLGQPQPGPRRSNLLLAGARVGRRSSSSAARVTASRGGVQLPRLRALLLFCTQLALIIVLQGETGVLEAKHGNLRC